MKSLSNVKLASEYFLNHDFNDGDLSNTVYDIQPVKGYLTTKVYRLSLTVANVQTVKYVKESSDLKNSKFNDFIKTEYVNTKYIYDNFNLSSKISVVQPVIYYDKYKIFFMNEIVGDRLDEIILKHVFFRRSKKLLDIVALSKQWIEAFQSISNEEFRDFSAFDFNKSEHAKIKHLHVRSLDNCIKSDVKAIDLIFNKAYTLSDEMEISKSDVAFKHNDFAPWNVKINNGLFTVYDFADISVDYKYYDLMYFVHSLSKLTSKIPFSNGVFEMMKSEMLKDTGISSVTERYYTIYFYLQDIALLLTKVNGWGVKSIFYQYKYKKILKKVTLYLDKL